MRRRHRDAIYYLVGRGYVTAPAKGEKAGPFGLTADDVTGPAPPPPDPERAFRFGLMFQNPELPAFRPDDPGLIELGLGMTDSPALGDHPSLPAGYTYLGQFIAHDMSFDQTDGLPDGALTPDQIKQGRSPSLDLDSLYGLGPLTDRKLYQADGLKLRVGDTTKTFLGDADQVFPNDLFREKDEKGNPRQAVIADSRNDGNLALAQTHLAFIKFHNRVIDLLAQQGLSGNALFTEARKQVTRHYQWIVLHDFLPRVIEKSALDDLVKAGPRHFKVGRKDELFIPIEFAVAAYRFGHSLIQDRYEWNRVFQSPKGDLTDAARLHQLFTFTGLNGNMQQSPTLPSNWIIDWTRFYDFSGFDGVANHPKSNRARKLGPSLTLALGSIPGFPAGLPAHLRSVAVRDLLRARLLGLPTGQAVAERLHAERAWVEPLSAEQIAQGPHQEVLKKYGFDRETPLWYYILKEAEVIHRGERLGPVGSYLVAETFVGLLQADPDSILGDAGWRPDLGQIKADQFGMADLLICVNDLNPLGA